MNSHLYHMKKEWDDRSIRLGCSQRAVLFKRFPSLFNYLIHRQHVRFITEQIPPLSQSILDVGCGYGRLSYELKRFYPETTFQGVDFCEEFAKTYERLVGPCFCGPVEAFHPAKKFDVILAVTLLMYLEPENRALVIANLWDLLLPGGVLISIEPAIEFNQFLARITKKIITNPTGGDVGYFTIEEVRGFFSNIQPKFQMVSAPIGFLGRKVPVHHALSVVKKVKE